MKYITLLIVLLICATWLAISMLRYGCEYRIEHEKLFMRLIEQKHGTPPPVLEGVKIPGGIEVRPGTRRA